MALRFVDGFDSYSISQILRKWTFVGSGSFSIGSSGARNGSALTFPTNVGFSAGALVKALDNQATLIVGFACKFPTAPVPTSGAPILCFGDNGSAQVTLMTYAGGSNLLQVRRGGATGTSLGFGTIPIPINVWFYLEMKVTINNTTGVIVVKINGQTSINLSSQNTRSTSNNFANSIVFNSDYGAVTSPAVAWLLDDVYMCDTSGSANTDFLGDCKVESLVPNGAGNYSQWTPSAGSNYQNVDENPSTDDTDYNSSNTLNQIDTYTFGNISGSPSSILGLQTNILARKDDAGVRTIKPLIRIGSTDYLQTEVAMNDGYYYHLECEDVSPDTSSAWTSSEINNAEFGQKLIA